MEDFVTYDLAVKLKEKGFKEKCIAYYWEKINEHTPSFVVEDNIHIPDEGICILDLLSEHNKAEWSPFIDAPTISQVLKWLREEKKLFVYISMAYNKYYVGICKTDEFDEVVGRQVIEHAIGTPSNTYDEAAIAGIEYVINNLI